MAAMTKAFKIILGSSSVARKQILSEMGYEFTVMAADIDEKSIRKEKPEELVMTIAEAKSPTFGGMEISFRQMPSWQGFKPLIIKTRMLTQHFYSLLTRWWSMKGKLEKSHPARKKHANSSKIYFHEIPDEVMDNLLEEGIVLKVAGGLIVEHPLILPLVEAVVGTTDSVMGLPKALTQKLIQEAL